MYLELVFSIKSIQRVSRIHKVTSGNPVSSFFGLLSNSGKSCYFPALTIVGCSGRKGGGGAPCCVYHITVWTQHVQFS